MGCGKTTVGRLLAREMERVFVDLDRRIEQVTGEPIRETFAGKGERAFRAFESAELERASEEPRVVVATGGGVMSSLGNREIMGRSGTTVWLRPSLGALLDRLESGRSGERPLFVDRQQAATLYRSRHGDYARADLTLDVDDGETPEAVAERLAALLR